MVSLLVVALIKIWKVEKLSRISLFFLDVSVHWHFCRDRSIVLFPGTCVSKSCNISPMSDSSPALVGRSLSLVLCLTSALSSNIA